MEFFPSPLIREESDAMADRFEGLISERGWGLWAVELKTSGAFIVFVGLHTPADLPFSPCTEVGVWRMTIGHGFATEAAQAALRIGFEVLGLEEIVSFTTVANFRSRAVMERASAVAASLEARICGELGLEPDAVGAENMMLADLSDVTKTLDAMTWISSSRKSRTTGTW